jgi:hypothetical protein
VKKITTLSGRRAKVPCRGCFEPIRRGARLVWEEDVACYIVAARMAATPSAPGAIAGFFTLCPFYPRKFLNLFQG